MPTPTIGGVGLLPDSARMATVALKREGDAIVLIGESNGHLGQSLYLREIEGREEGSAPPVDLAQERRNGDFVRRLIEAGRLDTVHDISDGGLLIAVAEMCMAGGIGAKLDTPDGIPLLFGEDQGRYILAAPAADAKDILSEAERAGIAAETIGTSGGAELSVPGMEKIRIATLKAEHETWFPSYMSSS